MNMRLTFRGAAQTVTGSMHEIQTNGHRYLLDCGLYQGRRKEAEERNRNFPFPAAEVEIASETSAQLGIAIARDLVKRHLVGYRNILECIEATGIKVPAGLLFYCERALQVDGHDDSPAATDLGIALLEAGVPPPKKAGIEYH